MPTLKKATILWVQNYSSLGLTLPFSRESAEGFAVGIGAAADLSDCEVQKDSGVREDLFKPQMSGAVPVEVAPVLYYSGHGTDEGPKFNDGQVATAHEIALGQNVVVAIFDCCKMLKDSTLWEKSFRGLRLMLGFTHSPNQSEWRGSVFANRLVQDKLPISVAWQMAAEEQGATSWHSLRAFVGKTAPPEEVWPPSGPLDIGKGGLQFIHRSGSPPAPIATLLGRADLLGSVRLYRTPKPISSEVSVLNRFATMFQLDAQEAVNGDRVKQFHAGQTTLEVFEESHSLWWNRKMAQTTELFKAIPPPGALSRETVAGLASMLSHELGLEMFRLGESWESFTTERHETQDGIRGQTFQVVRHLEFPLLLGGLPVFGPGARFRVSVQGVDLSEILLFSRSAIEDGDIRVMLPEQAKDILLKHDTFRMVSKYVKIVRSSLGYFSLPPREAQDHLIPVYAFEGIVSTPAFPDHRFVRFVQAVPEEVRREWPDETSVFKRPNVFP